jgi:triphosphatase
MHTPAAISRPREVELKLELDASARTRLKKELRGRAAGPVATERLHATYFDTHDQVLRRAGIALRLRRHGRRLVQTIKAADGTGAGLFDRAEWEKDVSGDTPDLDAARETGLAPFQDPDVVDALRPAFQVRVERMTAPLRHGVSRVEAVLDLGEVARPEGGAPAAICELELELEAGDPADLFGLARDLDAVAPLRPGLLTKSERGYRLGEDGPVVQKAAAIELHGDATVAQAFQAVARSCLHHLLVNEPVLRMRQEPGAVHQMRVALRRLRAALSLFREAVEDERRAAIGRELKWLADSLGEARDLDVYLAGTLAPLQAEDRDGALAEEVAAVEARRDAAYGTARDALASVRLRHLLLDLVAWIEAGPWLSTENPSRTLPVRAFAREELRRRRRRIRRRGADLAGLDDEARHRLRIAVKKLRYAAEFFGSLYRGGGRTKRRKAFVGALEALQEQLGTLNDLAVGEGLSGGEGDAGERIERQRQARFEEALEGARAAFRRFDAAEPFWR